MPILSFVGETMRTVFFELYLQKRFADPVEFRLTKQLHSVVVVIVIPATPGTSPSTATS